MNESELDILQKSLKIIADFPECVNTINSAKEFLSIHHRNLKMLSNLGIERKSTFIEKSLSEYPAITATEIELFIAKKNKQRSLLWIDGGIVVDTVHNLIRSKGTTLPQIRQKLTDIKSLNEKMQKVVEDPIYEELYAKTMHNNI